MPRNGPKVTSEGSNRIRFIMLEAELNDGNLSQVAQAITNAVRQANGTTSTRLIGTHAAQSRTDGEANDGTALPADEVESRDEIDETNDQDHQRTPRQRKPPKPPEVVPNLDLTGDVSFKDFATEKKPQNDSKRFLVVAAWFKRYKNLDAITVDHVYTCYRTMSWPYGIEDYHGVFRQLKKRKLVGRTAKGQYAINQIGEQLVDELTAD